MSNGIPTGVQRALARSMTVALGTERRQREWEEANGVQRNITRYGVFTDNGIDKTEYLTTRDDDTCVVFDTEAEAVKWAEDNYPSFFESNPNGWQSFGFTIRPIGWEVC